MINITQSTIGQVAAHRVGNKNNGEAIQLSSAILDITDDATNDLMFTYFLHPFNTQEYYSFGFSNDDISLNAIYKYASEIFENKNSFFKNTVNIAKHLYELSVHPQIKAGDLFVAFINDIEIENESVNAIGIFKVENQQSFLKLNNKNKDFYILQDQGININKLDKACLIFNTDKENGYKICVIDNTNKGSEAQFWKNDFLNVHPCKDNFHHTKDYLNMCKSFVTTQLPKEFEVNKTEQIDLLNRSINYFKEQDNFDIQQFSEQIITAPEVIESFKNYKSKYEDDNEIVLVDSFEISNAAVKKQNKSFKSVLKLDKNFHIYIHGDRNLIEKGTDPKTGKRFYKIYFDEES